LTFQRACELCRDEHAGQTSTQRSERVTGAYCLTTIVPALILREALDVTRVHAVVDLTGARTALVTTRPFRAPHHTISDAGLIGGGRVPMPRDMLQAHRAMLFLHRRLEGKRSVVEVLRLPLHDLLLTPERLCLKSQK
jgi:magnesium chelatase family protein